MARRKHTPPLLRPVYVAPVFDPLERDALRAWRWAAYTAHQPKPGDFDPLHLRMGMRMCAIHNRAGWVVSNPTLDEVLRRNPAMDESLGGPWWLRAVYRGQHRHLVSLPAVHAVVDAWIEAGRRAEMPPPAVPAVQVAAEPQGELF